MGTQFEPGCPRFARRAAIGKALGVTETPPSPHVTRGRRWIRDGVRGVELTWNDTSAWLLSPREAEHPLPAILLMHGHDGVKFYGKEKVAAAIEEFFAELARLLAQAGIRRLISAGGETSGAVVSGLAIPAFEIGPEIDPGVPALRVVGGDLVLALKSGNFGADDFFAKAAAVLAGAERGGEG